MSTAAGYKPTCAYSPRMTRAQAIALRTAGALDPNCVVVITDGPVIGTAGNTSPTEIELNPVSATDLGTTARVHTTFSQSAMSGIYRIDLGTGTITELRDGSGNVAKDTDSGSATVTTQVPWHLSGSNFRDNYFEDSVLTGFSAAVGAFTNNRVIESTLDFTGKTGGTVNLTEFVSATVTAAGSFAAVRTKFLAGTLTKDAVTGPFSSANASLRVMTISMVGGSTGSLTVNDSDLDSSVITLPASNTGNVLYYAGNDGQLSCTHAGAGNVAFAAVTGRQNFVSAAASDHNTAVTRVGGTGNVTIRQNSTGGHVTTGDNILGCIIEGDAEIQLNNTTDVARTYSKLAMDSGGLLTVADPGATPNCLGQVRIDTIATLNLQAGGSVYTSRFSNAAIFNTGAFQHEQVIIEGGFTKTATAANFLRLCSKAFDDIV